ncbi:MAG: Fusaric acid resistance family protein [Frondihabitans sp.]|nr:Fusaric acid resistance family protein [Frondihabitans sp.]
MAVTVLTALISVAVALLLIAPSHSGPDLVVLAVMLSISFTRERAGATLREKALGAVALPLVGIGAGLVGALLVAAPVVGAAVFVIVTSGAIWLRRFGPLASRLGTLIALPFIAILVAPLPVRPGGFFAGWTALVALTVVVVGALLDLGAQRLGLIPPIEAKPPDPAPRVPAAMTGRRRIAASTRMAAQMAVALGVAFPLGHLAFGEHWPWLVLTAYIVSSGNRGRGDVVYKGVLRILGALGGVVIGTLLALIGHHGDPLLLLALGVVIVAALWLRPLNYAWWAAGVTAALALLYDYVGSTSSDALLIRLIAIAVGGVIAVLSAWFVLPVRTVDVVRRRVADVLAAVSGVLGELLEVGASSDVQESDQAAAAARAAALRDRWREYTSALARLREVSPALRAHRVAIRRGAGDAHPAALVDLLVLMEEPLAVLVETAREGVVPRGAVGRAAKRTGEARRVLGGREVPDGGVRQQLEPADPPSRAAARLVSTLDALMPSLAALRR